MPKLRFCRWMFWIACLLGGCVSGPRGAHRLARRGDEIIACGQLFHIGTPVVTWLDPGGYDAYRVERRFVPAEQADWKSSKAENPGLDTPNRYGFRRSPTLPPAELEHVRTNGWDLPALQRVVDQFVIHFDASGTSRRCFQVLQDQRGLSVHFLLDADGTLYQTLDLKERAWHATTANTRAVGLEIAQIGAVPLNQAKRLEAWYTPTSNGPPRLTFPEWIGPSGIRTPGFVGHPARPEPIIGAVQGEMLMQYDFTPEQYAALIRLTRALNRIFPRIHPVFPRDSAGQVRMGVLSTNELSQFQGILGHYHIQREKTDPGPAFDWERLQRGIR